MKEDRTRSGPATDLRKQAEEKFRAEESETQCVLSPEQARQVLHDLRVHQIELEMQNEELRRAQAEIERSRERYFDLYDVAPVGYFTLNEAGVISEANLTAAELLGVDRSAMVNLPLSRFIFPADQDIFYKHRRKLVETGSPQMCEIRLLKKGSVPFWAGIKATIAKGASDSPVFRTVISDITERRNAELERNLALELFELIHFKESGRSLLPAVSALFQKRSGCDSVGIRVSEGEDYINYESPSSSPHSLNLEKGFCPRASGCIQLDAKGGGISGCFCENLLGGKCDFPGCLTAHGSFWSSDLPELIKTLPSIRSAQLQGQCLQNGYRSVAWIPLGRRECRTGLLQLNAYEQGHFTPESISMWERMGQILSTAIGKLQAEEALQRANAGLEGRVQTRTADLQLANTALGESEERFRQIAHKEVGLRREINHRVKNNLQVITSLLYLQSTKIEDPKMIDLLRESQARVGALGLVYDRLCQQERSTGISFDDYVKQLASEIFSAYQAQTGRIALRISAEEAFLDLDAAVPCGLILTELITNALRHAFPEDRSGEISIGVQRAEGGLLCLSVSDNGVGLPDGFNWERAKTMGLDVVRDLTRQLGGQLEFFSEQGTTARISFRPAGIS